MTTSRAGFAQLTAASLGGGVVGPTAVASGGADGAADAPAPPAAAAGCGSAPGLFSAAAEATCVGGTAPLVGAGALSLQPPQRTLLARMVQSHAAGRDLCVLGGHGEGKTHMAGAFGAALGYVPETLFLFADMTAR